MSIIEKGTSANGEIDEWVELNGNFQTLILVSQYVETNKLNIITYQNTLERIYRYNHLIPSAGNKFHFYNHGADMVMFVDKA